MSRGYTSINSSKGMFNPISFVLTTIFNIPDLEITMNVHRDQMVSKGKEKMDFMSVSFECVDKLKNT
jgi:hypothetical protein